MAAEHVEQMREAARLMRHGHVPTGADWRRMAELMEGAAAREVRYLASVKPPPGGFIDEPIPLIGDEAWLALELARAYLGRSAVDRG